MGKWCEMATVDVKYDTTPHDGTPGPPWDDFEERILGVAAGRTDERGWSLADCANQTDEGGVGGPPMPAAGAAAAKAQTARRKRLKELYALLYKHELDTDHRTHVYQNHFQDGDGAFQYLIATMRVIYADALSPPPTAVSTYRERSVRADRDSLLTLNCG